MKFFKYFLLGSVLSLPAFGNAQTDSFADLLAQAPAPPASVAAAELRWHEGHEDSGSEEGFDKSADTVLAKLDSLQKSQMTTSQTFGGDTAEEVGKKMQSMTQAQQLAYAMQLSKKMQQDQQAAYANGGAQAMMQAQQNDVADVHKGLAATAAAKAMSDTDDAFAKKYDALLTKMLADVKACPIQTIGQASGPSKACVQTILPQYKQDYINLTDAKMASYTAIYLKFKKAAALEIKGWSSDIDALKGNSSEAANNTIVRKKMLIYEEIKALTIPADKAVNFGHEADIMKPEDACGGNCDID